MKILKKIFAAEDSHKEVNAILARGKSLLEKNFYPSGMAIAFLTPSVNSFIPTLSSFSISGDIPSSRRTSSIILFTLGLGGGYSIPNRGFLNLLSPQR